MNKIEYPFNTFSIKKGRVILHDNFLKKIMNNKNFIKETFFSYPNLLFSFSINGHKINPDKSLMIFALLDQYAKFSFKDLSIFFELLPNNVEINLENNNLDIVCSEINSYEIWPITSLSFNVNDDSKIRLKTNCFPQELNNLKNLLLKNVSEIRENAFCSSLNCLVNFNVSPSVKELRIHTQFCPNITLNLSSYEYLRIDLPVFNNDFNPPNFLSMNDYDNVINKILFSPKLIVNPRSFFVVEYFNLYSLDNKNLILPKDCLVQNSQVNVENRWLLPDLTSRSKITFERIFPTLLNENSITIDFYDLWLVIAKMQINLKSPFLFKSQAENKNSSGGWYSQTLLADSRRSVVIKLSELIEQWKTLQPKDFRSLSKYQELKEIVSKLKKQKKTVLFHEWFNLYNK